MKAYIAASAVIALINNALLFASPSYASEFFNITEKSNRIPPSFPKISGPGFPSELPGHWDPRESLPPNFDNIFIPSETIIPDSCSASYNPANTASFETMLDDYETGMNTFKRDFFPESDIKLSDNTIITVGDHEFSQEESPLFKEAQDADLCNPDGAKTSECTDLLKRSLSDPMQANYGIKSSLAQTLVDFDNYKKSRPFSDLISNPDDDNAMDDYDQLSSTSISDLNINFILDRDDLSDEQKARQIKTQFDATIQKPVGLSMLPSDEEVKYRKKMTDEIVSSIDLKMATDEPIDKELEVLRSVNPSAAEAMDCLLSNSNILKDSYRKDGSVHKHVPPIGKVVGPLSGIVYADNDATKGNSIYTLYAAIIAGVFLLSRGIVDSISQQKSADKAADATRYAADKNTDTQNKTNLTQIYLACEKAGKTDCKNPYED